MARPSETFSGINLMSVKCYLQALAAWAESERKLMEQGLHEIKLILLEIRINEIYLSEGKVDVMSIQ